MRRDLSTLAAVFLFLLGPPIFAQSSAGPYTLSANAQCTKPVDTAGLTVLGMQITGTAVLTLQPEVSLGGQTPADTVFTQSTSTTGPVSTYTTSGATNVVFSSTVAGAKNFLLCVSAYTSGSVTVYFQGSNLSAKGIGGAGGSGGSYTFFGNTQNPLTALADPTVIQDVAGNLIDFAGAGAFEFANSLNVALVLGSGWDIHDAAGNNCIGEASPSNIVACTDVAGDFVQVGGANPWKIGNAAGSASIANTSSNAILVHGATTIDDLVSCTGTACGGAPGGSTGDVQYKTSGGAFGGSATTINAAGSLTIPASQSIIGGTDLEVASLNGGVLQFDENCEGSAFTGGLCLFDLTDSGIFENGLGSLEIKANAASCAAGAAGTVNICGSAVQANGSPIIAGTPTGTGSPVLSASPALTGTPTVNGNAICAPGSFAAQTDGSTVTWAIGSAVCANASLLFTTHGGSRTLNLTGLVNGGSYVLKITQDGTGGEGLTLGTGCTWKVSGGGSGAITPSTGAGAVDVLAFTYDGTNCLLNFAKNFS